MNKWKVTALIFIGLFVVQSILSISLFGYGLKLTNKENKCGIECSEIDINAAYYYDFGNICECYVNGKLVKSIYMD